MNRMDMSRPYMYLQPEEKERTRRLTRHLHARMEELEEQGLEITAFSQEQGLVAIAAPEMENLAGRLRWEWGVHGEAEGETVKLWTNPELRFEDLDALWGALNELLSE